MIHMGYIFINQLSSFFFTLDSFFYYSFDLGFLVLWCVCKSSLQIGDCQEWGISLFPKLALLTNSQRALLPHVNYLGNQLLFNPEVPSSCRRKACRHWREDDSAN